jgi:hypothetical protein
LHQLCNLLDPERYGPSLHCELRHELERGLCENVFHALEQERQVLKEDMWGGLDIIVREVPIVRVDYGRCSLVGKEGLVIKSVDVNIDQVNDFGISKKRNADDLYLGVLVP